MSRQAINEFLAHEYARLADSVESPERICLEIFETMARREYVSCSRRVDAALSGLNADQVEYIVSSLYTKIIGKDRQSELAAFFTPPWLAKTLLDVAEECGADWSRHRVLDPASGGAAFVSPLASRMAGLPTSVLVERLRGVEIDTGLAALSQAFLRHRLVNRFGVSDTEASELSTRIVTCADALAMEVCEPFDVIVGNPPYGKLSRRRASALYERHADIVSGALNLYTVFVRESLERLRPGGLLAFVIPSGFLGGPYFARFRERVLELAWVERIDRVQERHGVFVDVQQDTCLLILRKKGASRARGAFPASAWLSETEGRREGWEVAIPDAGNAPWIFRERTTGYRAKGDGLGLPGSASSSNLITWGWKVGVGAHVPHRGPGEPHERLRKGRFPLVWEKCIRHDGSFDFDALRGSGRAAFLEIADNAAAIVRTPCVLVQRTSNSKQKRRLFAAAVPQAFLERYGGFVGENHVVQVVPGPMARFDPAVIAAVLNSAAVNATFAAMSGSVNVSARLLAQTPLPDPDAFEEALRRGCDVEDALEESTASGRTFAGSHL
ncbi:N-6 DNA methylase [Azospirillum sp. TSO22-1]|uniref:HsdM family class I SAM-dependent methyltransferase n=1 Tax=Azospirillum sp. TSO22-1 TaxID=716789 RepID=UPI000D65E69A|nr:N-6 DNA methylase [Azospirillum sp. TSO22-1]